MERLRGDDLQNVLNVLGDLAGTGFGVSFPEQALAAVRGLVPCDHAAYNEIDPKRASAVVVMDPPDALFPGGLEIFAEHALESPLVRYHQSTGDGAPLKLSDFIGRRDLHRLPLYQLAYKPVSTEHQMAFMLSAPPLIGISLNRSRTDFSERDRAVLDVLRPHLRRAYLQWSAGGTLAGAIDAGGRGAILLSQSGETEMMTDQAQRWLQAYCGPPRGWSGRLPEFVLTWLRRQRAFRGDTDSVPAAVGPLIVSRLGDPRRRLTLRLIGAGRARDQDLVVLEEEMAESVAAYALSTRELEVLRQAATGATDAAISDALNVSRRTVNGHLQHIYRKIGVSNRTSAIAWIRGLHDSDPD